MARYKLEGVFVDQVGNAVSEGIVTPYEAGTTTAVSIYEAYADEDAVNSVTADSNGRWEFYVDDGDYAWTQLFDIRLSKDATAGTAYTTQTYEDISMEQMQLVDTLDAAASVSTSDTVFIIQGGVRKTATVAQILAAS